MTVKRKQRSLFHKIVNGFILILTGLVFLLIVLIGFSQTKTFRELLRENIIAYADSTLNGKLSIDRIDGSIISSLSLRNTVLHYNNDTLFSAQNIELHLSPHKLLFKKLYARKIVIIGAHISLIENEPGLWNIDQILGAGSEPDSIIVDETLIEDGDTEPPAFPFVIQANDLQIRGLSFVRKSYSNLKSDTETNSFDVDNLSIKQLNLNAAIIANISDNDYRLNVENLSLIPNFHTFNLNKFACDIRVTEKYADISDLVIQTDSSDLRLSVRLDSINIFGKVDLNEFKDYPIYFDLDAYPFCFEDLTSFITSTDLLKGNLSFSSSGLGSFGDLSILDLQVKFQNTFLNMTGDIHNLHTPENLSLEVSVQNSFIEYQDVLTLLPSLELPEFTNLSFSEINIDYAGRPTNFSTNMTGLLNGKYISLEGSLNLDSKIMGYDVKFGTDEVNLFPVISTATSLSTSGFIRGKGTSIEELDSEFEVTFQDSYFDKHTIDSTLIIGSAHNNIVDLDVASIFDSSSTKLNCRFNFTDKELPEMDLSGNIENLDLAIILDDPQFASMINLNLSANIKGDDINRNSGKIMTEFYDTRFDQLYFPNLHFSLLAGNTENGRTIEILSNLIDIKLDGDYLITDVIEVVSFETAEILNIFSRKFSDINPLDSTFAVKMDLEERINIENEIIKNIKLDYSFIIKENDLFKVLLQQDDISLEGRGSGKIKNDSTNFTIDSEVFLDHFFINNNGDMIYFSDLDVNINFTQDSDVNTFNNLFGSISINSERIMAGARIDNLSADFIFNENEFYYNIYSEIDTSLKTSIDGKFKLGTNIEQLAVDELYVDYKDIEWKNTQPFTIDFFPDSIRINDMNIAYDTTSLLVDGTISRTKSQQLNISLQKLPGNVLGYYIFGFFDKNFSAGAYLSAVIEGNLLSPTLSADFNLNNLRLDENKFGNIECNLNYSNSSSHFNLVFLDTLRNVQKPYITIDGTIPQYFGIDENYKDNTTEPIAIRIIADNFNLLNLGHVIPTVRNQTGIFKSDIKISGQLNEPLFDGYMEIDRGKFKSTLNNLDYLVDIKLLFNNSQITVDNFRLANSANTKLRGTITGSGFFDLDIEDPTIELVLAGDITLLSEQSRGVSPNAYGDLFVSSDRPWRYSYSNNQSYFDGDFIIKSANITFTPSRSGYTVTDDIIYNIKIDSSKIDQQSIKFEKLVKNINTDMLDYKNKFFDNFSFDTNLRIENNARLIFLLSKTLNQRLTVEAEGSLNYSTVDNEPVAQGEFKLLPGSKLDFFKSLDAEGSIRFESDITDPFIDVVAVYQADYYYPGTSEAVPTAVKIKIQSTAQNLNKYLNESNDNVNVYSGTHNIENNSPDNRYEATDAITFILVGKFPSDLSTGEKSTLTQTFALDAAGSVLGNALTSVLNSQVGDLVNDVRFSSSGERTKVSVSGRIEDFRYSIGGTSSEGQNLSDITLADVDVKIEYPITAKFLLRLERKNSITQETSSSNVQKINELGLKYLFVF